MSARDVVLTWMTGQAEPGWDEDDPKYQAARKELNAYHNQVLREAAAELRAWGEDGDARKRGDQPSPFYMWEDADRAADLIDPDSGP